jgi:NAD(P)-dependent dehydrogenase (short-subunit alcohol dehydrogenase family)
MTELTGRVVAVTGGARGIGLATAKALAAAGARVAIGDLDGDLAGKEAAELGGVGLPLDVTSEESFATFLDTVEGQLGRLDGLVNNAGIMVIGRHLEVPLDRQLAQLDVNLRGVIVGCHLAAPRLLASGGTIVNIASLAARIPPAGGAVYAATKAGVLALSEALDAELAPQGVRVAAVLPSFTRTALIDGTEAPWLSPPIDPERVAAKVVDALVRPRLVTTVPGFQAVNALQWRLLPTRARRWLSARSGLDAVFTEFDHEARASYDDRVSAPKPDQG